MVIDKSKNFKNKDQNFSVISIENVLKTCQRFLFSR